MVYDGLSSKQCSVEGYRLIDLANIFLYGEGFSSCFSEEVQKLGIQMYRDYLQVPRNHDENMFLKTVHYWKTWDLVVLFDFGALQSLWQLLWSQCLWKTQISMAFSQGDILRFAFYHAAPNVLKFWGLNPNGCLRKLSFDGFFRESLCRLGIPHYSQMYHRSTVIYYQCG